MKCEMEQKKIGVLFEISILLVNLDLIFFNKLEETAFTTNFIPTILR